MPTNRECYLCNGTKLNNLQLCDCSTNIIQDSHIQCRGCGSLPTLQFCNSIDCKNARQKNIEARIQNQVGVSQNQMNSVRSSFYIREINGNNVGGTLSGGLPSSRVWGNSKNLRNQSDRLNIHYQKNNNVPTRGNSIKSSVTSNRPGSMCPGGKGVDVKHGSYARYLGKIKANNIEEKKMGPFNILEQDVNGSVSRLKLLTNERGSRNRPVVNNKLFRFSIVNTGKCC